MAHNDLPLGIFDSGVGGLTVMAEVIKALPFESIAYLGDTARLPYGNKSQDTVLRFSLENARYLTACGIKLLVVACNTSASVALETLQQTLPIPVIGVIEPGVAEAVKATKSGHVAVLGTRGTIRSGAYQKAIQERVPGIEVHAHACPLFVPFVEENLIDHPAAQLMIRDYLQPLRDTAVDTIILGCTHYPLLRGLIQLAVGSHVTIVDSALACAQAVAAQLGAKALAFPTARSPQYRYFVSDDPENFRCIGSRIVGRPIDSVMMLGE